jgi:hypothetical protein
MTIYEKIERAKKEFGYTNRILGDVVGKEEPAFGQSMRRKSLSDLEIKELERFLSNESETKNPSTIKDEGFFKNDNNRLVTENEFLKQTIKDLLKILSGKQ